MSPSRQQSSPMAPAAMPVEELVRWLQARVDRHPAATSLAMLDGYVAAIVAGPVSMSPLDWICPAARHRCRCFQPRRPPILLHYCDDQGPPLLAPPRSGRETGDFLRNAYADIPAAVEATPQYWMPIRYARAPDHRRRGCSYRLRWIDLDYHLISPVQSRQSWPPRPWPQAMIAPFNASGIPCIDA